MVNELLLLWTLGMSPIAASEATARDVPVLAAIPACKHTRVGAVDVELGVRVAENTDPRLVPLGPVRYRAVFAKMADAAVEKGGNAVVLNWHQATHFTSGAKRTRLPVHVKVMGIVIRLEEPTACKMTVIDPTEFQERVQAGKPVNVGSAEAYSD